VGVITDSRAAITGVGVLTPHGAGTESLLDAMLHGRQALSHLTDRPVPRGKDLFGMVVDPSYRRPDRASQMAITAVLEAVADADKSLSGVPSAEIGLLLSTTVGDSHALEDAWDFGAGDDAATKISEQVRLYPNGSVASALVRRFQFRGPTLVISNACAGGNVVAGLGLDLLRLGRCRAVVAVGVECFKLSTLWGAERAGFIGRSLRPFHPLRNGTVLAEGAAAIVLQHPDDIHSPPRGWLEGYGCACDEGAPAIAMVEGGEAVTEAMLAAIRDARREPSEIDYVSAHAPGTARGDLAECIAVERVFQGVRQRTMPAVNSTKSLTGHLSAASGLVEIIAALMQMERGFVHATSGLNELDSALPLEPVRSLRRTPIRLALSNASGGGGVNTSVVLADAAKPPAPPLRRTLSLDIGITSVSATITSKQFDWVRPAGRVPHSEAGKFLNAEHFEDVQKANNAARLAFVAAHDAAAQAWPDGVPYLEREVAVVAGTMLGGTPEWSELLCWQLHRNPKAILPSMSLNHGIHYGASLISRGLGLRGPTYTIAGLSSAGLQALWVARDLIACGRAKAALVIAYDAVDETVRRGMNALGSDPDSIAEGALAVVVESRSPDGAKSRDAGGKAVLGEPIRLHFGPTGGIEDGGVPSLESSDTMLIVDDPCNRFDVRQVNGTVRETAVEHCPAPHEPHHLAAEGLLAVAGLIQQAGRGLVGTIDVAGASAIHVDATGDVVLGSVPDPE
jgi:3-oxoacyl-[acyl-carrier-protein] synthase II